MIFVDFTVCREGLETLSVVLALYPPALETLTKDSQFHKLVMGLVLVGGERSIRQCAVEQLLLMATKCSNSPHTLVVFIVMLFNVLNGLNGEYSKEYFQVCTFQAVMVSYSLNYIAGLTLARSILKICIDSIFFRYDCIYFI